MRTLDDRFKKQDAKIKSAFSGLNHPVIHKIGIDLGSGIVLTKGTPQNIALVAKKYKELYGKTLEGMEMIQVFNHLNKGSETVSLEDVFLLRKGIEPQMEKQLQTFEMHRHLKMFYQSRENQIAMKEIVEMKGDNGYYIRVYRGASYEEAMAILTHNTVGGNQETGKIKRPTEKQVRLQIGRAIKSTREGRVQEWTQSLRIASSFGRNSLVLGAIVDSRDVIITKSSELGVIGDAATPLKAVGLLDINPMVSFR